MVHLHFDFTLGLCCAIVSVSQIKISFSDACKSPVVCTCFRSPKQEAI